MSVPPEVSEVSCPDCQTKTSPGEAPGCSCCDERRPASVRCEDCQDLLCVDCLAAHRRVRLTRDHRIVQLQVQPGVAAYCPLSYCGQPCLYCHSCQKLFCRQCSLRADLARKNLDLELKSAEMQESINNLDKQIANIDSEEQNLIQELVQVKANLIRSVGVRQQELDAEVSQVSSQTKKTLENRRSHLDRILAQTNTAIGLLRDLSTSSVSTEKMILMEGVVARMVTSLEKVNTSIGDRKESDLQSRQLEPLLEVTFSKGLEEDIEKWMKIGMEIPKV